jgi:hypothetical protein
VVASGLVARAAGDAQVGRFKDEVWPFAHWDDVVDVELPVGGLAQLAER